MNSVCVRILVFTLVAFFFLGCGKPKDVSNVLDTNTVSGLEQRIFDRVNSFNSNYIGIKLSKGPEGVELKTNGVSKFKNDDHPGRISLNILSSKSKIKITGEFFLIGEEFATIKLPNMPIFVIKKSKLDAILHSCNSSIEENYKLARDPFHLSGELNKDLQNALRDIHACADNYNAARSNFVEKISKTEFEVKRGVVYRWRIAANSQLNTQKNRQDAVVLNEESKILLESYKIFEESKRKCGLIQERIKNITTYHHDKRREIYQNFIQQIISQSEVASDTSADGNFDLNFARPNDEKYHVCAVAKIGREAGMVFSREIEYKNLSNDLVLTINLSNDHLIQPDAKILEVQNKYFEKQIVDAEFLIKISGAGWVAEEPEEFDVLFEE
jgi:hypothetical protein